MGMESAVFVERSDVELGHLVLKISFGSQQLQRRTWVLPL